MDEQIRITLPEVSNTAVQIRACNSNLDDTLSYVYRTMNELDSVWDSDGERTLLNRFRIFSQRFTDESETIETYASFLDRTVASYDTLESTIVANAENFN